MNALEHVNRQLVSHGFMFPEAGISFVFLEILEGGGLGLQLCSHWLGPIECMERLKFALPNIETNNRKCIQFVFVCM